MNIMNINNITAGAGLSARVAQAQQQASPLPDIRGIGSSRSSDANDARAVAENQAASALQGAELEQAVRDSVEKLNDFIRPYVTSLQFSVDKDLGKLVVKILDSETSEVIKQIPSEEVIALTKAMSKVEGLFVQQKA